MPTTRPTDPPRARPYGIPRGLRRDGPVLFSYGFRPFFLGAGVFAVVAMALWIGALTAGLPIGGAYGAAGWHAHEMLFGFAPAVLAGFLMTAIPNWTGQMPLAGRPLAMLAGLWLAGRVAMLAAGVVGAPVAAAVDAAFLPALATACARELIAGKKWKDLKVLVGVAVIAAANIGFHAEVLLSGAPGMAARAGVAGFALLVTIIGGRIIPSFTRNWLAMAGASRLPVAFNGQDGVAIGVGLVGLVAWVVAPEGWPTAAAALVAAVAVAWRLSRWRGAATWREPLLLVLHVAFGFLGLGFVAIAAAALGWLPQAAAMHVLTVGGIAGTMLAVMTRATRGHTGRPLVASRWTQASYLCLFGAALARPAADLAGDPRLLDLAGGLWIAAFLLFLAEYAPMLLLDRQRSMR
ncbi:NnrS family protein [Amaricoccus sp.]|uniref:NnrS family protein n=1 Tax=Amaricoccus sp. TaxID=1872485 RepID=UPI001B58A7DD|nr:NnrS family protein [Amaricoccus sp.]MBP7002053.1 NnrS family protein [Amaricoccus sp.]